MTVLTGQTAAWWRTLATVESFQWYRGNEAIRGATGRNYTLQREDVGQQISRETVRVAKWWAWWLR